MSETTTQTPISLYVEDETAWLELTSRLVAEGRFHEVDAASLSEYLSDMAIRDRREVMSRLAVLLTHLLKWDHQPAKRTASWPRAAEAADEDACCTTEKPSPTASVSVTRPAPREP